MSRRIYDQGQLVEEWNDTTRVYRRWSNGVLVEERPYTQAEIDAILGLGGIEYRDDEILMLDDDGSVIFRLGPQQYGDRGLEIRRIDGVIAFQIRKLFSNSTLQNVQFYDRYGNGILAESTFGTGLGKPCLPIPLQPVGAAPSGYGPYGVERTTTSATFEDLFRWQGARQNGWYRPVFNVRCTVADTAAEIRVVDQNGGVLAGFFQAPWVGVVAAGSVLDQEVKHTAGLGLTQTYLTDQVVRIQARRTAGTGNVIVSVKKSEGGEP